MVMSRQAVESTGQIGVVNCSPSPLSWNTSRPNFFNVDPTPGKLVPFVGKVCILSIQSRISDWFTMCKATRRNFLKASLAAAAGSAGVGISRPAGAATKPLNVLLFTFDDCDAGSFGAFGNPMPGITPNSDALAARGCRFLRMHTTSSTCQPSRISLMTGRSTESMKVWGHNDTVPDGTATLASVLGDNGYFTAVIGKQIDMEPQAAFNWSRSRNSNGQYLTPDEWDDRDDGYWSMFRSPTGIARGVEELIGQSLGSGKPFFINVNTADPHRPWPGNRDELFFHRFFVKHPTPTGAEGYPIELKPIRPYARTFSPLEVFVPGYLPDIDGVRLDLAGYYGGVHNGDKALGRVIDLLERQHLLNDTIIIVVSDQGASFPLSKQSVYPHGTNTGTIIYWPGITRAGSTIEGLCSIGDITPTVLDGLGISRPEGMGISLLSAFSMPSVRLRQSHVASYNFARPGLQVFPMRSLIRDEFVLIHNAWHGAQLPDGRGKITYDGTIDPLIGWCWQSIKDAAIRDKELAHWVEFVRYRTTWELYDIVTDPFCRKNLAGTPEQADRQGEMTTELRSRLKETEDPILDAFNGIGPIPASWF